MSGDHGPFNNWDRQPFVSEYGVKKIPDTVRRNFLLANYHSQDAVDNDDGSSWWETYDNLLVYSENGLKSDFKSHDNHHYRNIYAFPGTAYRVTQANTDSEHLDWFHSNRVLLARDNSVEGKGMGCPGSLGFPLVWNSTFYTPSGNLTDCNEPLEHWVKLGYYNTTSVEAYPSTDEIMGWARTALGMPGTDEQVVVA